jgi:hypothetical protein
MRLVWDPNFKQKGWCRCQQTTRNHTTATATTTTTSLQLAQSEGCISRITPPRTLEYHLL